MTETPLNALLDRPKAEPAGVGEVTSSAEPNYDDHLEMLCRYFEESESATRRARALSERDRDYHDNFDDNQWTHAEKAALRKRGQPITTSNHVKRKVATLKGGEMRTRTDPKAFPRNPQDEQTAETATDVLRYIGDQNKFNQLRSKVYENFLIEGFGGIDVVAEEAPSNQKRVKLIRVPWDRLVYDPHSSAEDFSDGKYRGIVIWRDANRDDQDACGATLRSTAGGDTYDDRPKTSWVDSRRKRVRVVQMQYLHDDKWMVATFTKGGFLEKPQVSPYLDRDGNPTYSLIMRSAYVDRENHRYGAVRDWISTQDAINKRESKGLHLLNSRQTYGNKQAIADATAAKNEMAKPDGHLELNAQAQYGKDFGVIPTNDLAQGNLEMLQLAKQEMQASGPNAAMAGKAPGQQSGRALEAQMQAGAVEIEPLQDELRQFTRDVYEAAWLRARQFWDREMWIRVTDDDSNARFVGLNRPVTLGERLGQIEQQEGPEAATMAAQQAGIMSPYDPRLKEVVDTENQIGQLDVDIEVEEGPDISTLQSDEWETMNALLQRGMQLPPEAVIQASNLRASKKKALIAALKGEKGQPNPQLQQAQQQIQAMGQDLEALKRENEALKADKSIDAREAGTKQYEAETERMTAVAPALTPQDIAAIVTQTMQQVLGAQQPQQQVQPAAMSMQGPPPIQ